MAMTSTTETDEKAVASLDRLMRHFQVREDDTPDVRHYKEVVTRGLSCLGKDMQKLDEARAYLSESPAVLRP